MASHALTTMRSSAERRLPLASATSKCGRADSPSFRRRRAHSRCGPARSRIRGPARGLSQRGRSPPGCAGCEPSRGPAVAIGVEALCTHVTQRWVPGRPRPEAAPPGGKQLHREEIHVAQDLLRPLRERALGQQPRISPRGSGRPRARDPRAPHERPPHERRRTSAPRDLDRDGAGRLRAPGNDGQSVEDRAELLAREHRQIGRSQGR